MVSHLDTEFLARSLELAREGRDRVRPNPEVGAVVVHGTRVVAEGYHALFGGPHAEAVALEQAGETARGATLYCNLEPCSYSAPEKHNGPCTHKIIEAGVSRVVIGQLDPNPRVRGRGIQQLRDAGIQVDVAPDPSIAWYANARFNTAQTLRRPFVTMKLAQSLDGRLATAKGDSKWITDLAARQEVHALRASHDAVMVGIGTVLADDPQLTVRHASCDTLPTTQGGMARSQPRAVVLDSHCRIPPDSHLVSHRADDLTVVTATTTSPNRDSGRAEACRARGVTVIEVSAIDDGVDLIGALRALYQDGIQSLLVEGGPRLATSLARQSLFDQLQVYVSPILLGGDGAGLGPLGVDRVEEALRLEGVRKEIRAGHVVLSGFREGWLSETRRSIEEVYHVHRAG